MSTTIRIYYKKKWIGSMWRLHNGDWEGEYFKTGCSWSDEKFENVLDCIKGEHGCAD